MLFPHNLRRQRLAHFLSQAELARQSGLHALTVSRLESGRVKPSTRTVRALAQALGTTPGELATPDEVAEADKGLIHYWPPPLVVHPPSLYAAFGNSARPARR